MHTPISPDVARIIATSNCRPACSLNAFLLCSSLAPFRRPNRLNLSRTAIRLSTSSSVRGETICSFIAIRSAIRTGCTMPSTLFERTANAKRRFSLFKSRSWIRPGNWRPKRSASSIARTARSCVARICVRILPTGASESLSTQYTGKPLPERVNPRLISGLFRVFSGCPAGPCAVMQFLWDRYRPLRSLA